MKQILKERLKAKEDMPGLLVESFDNPVRISDWPDALGNRTQIKRYLPLDIPTFNLANSSYSYNSDNQLTSATNQSFAYDNNGNLLSRTNAGVTANLTYNYDNQLTQYTSGTTTLAYLYDALGNRIKKASAAGTTKYIVDPNRMLPSVLAETDASGNITAYYVYGLGVISKIVGTSAYFYQYDGLGSTVALTDANGIIKNKYAYDDFGNFATNSTETVANPFKYVGQYGIMTDINDLLFIRARYYMPSVGRFTNKDPVSSSESLNLYSYTGNNPINFVDPDGEAAWMVSGGIGAGVGFIGGAISHRVVTGSWKGAWKPAIRGTMGGFITGAMLPFGWKWGAFGGGASGWIDYWLFGGCNKNSKGYIKLVVSSAIAGGIAGQITKWLFTPRWIILK